MKQSEYLKILNLIKKSFEEYSNWGEDEIYKTSDVSVFCAKSILQKNKQAQLDQLKEKVSYCKKCSLGKSRLNVVFGVGAINADLVFIGEGPGYDEDHKGEPFIGRAGQLLTKIIEAMKQTRNTVYITNIVKCHPMIDSSNPEKRANDRPPTLEEVKICRCYLDMQLEIINPKIIITLGAFATKGLLGNDESISRMRGIVKEYKHIKLVPTYHPAALLRNPSFKKFVWKDIKKVMHYLDTGEI
jgi:DNA polymerase